MGRRGPDMEDPTWRRQLLEAKDRKSWEVTETGRGVRGSQAEMGVAVGSQKGRADEGFVFARSPVAWMRQQGEWESDLWGRWPGTKVVLSTTYGPH